MKEEEIRPQKIFDEYLQLAEKDAIQFFENTPRTPILCPACGTKGEHSFTKKGFSYEECPACQTLFVSPRPTAESFNRYYTEAESVKFWASKFYKETAEARREKLWLPKALKVKKMINMCGIDEHTVVDIGGGYGLFAEEYQKISNKKVIVIEPGPKLAQVCREKGLTVIENFMENVKAENLPGESTVFVSFELFEHLHNPELFLNQLFTKMKSGDLFIFTTLSGIGVDIQALWEDSKSASPPHHLNFFNPKSATMLLTSVGFEVLDTSTPGKLDINILSNNKPNIKDRFWKTFILQATEKEKKEMQTFIAEKGWSSHMMVVSKKP